MCYPAELLHAAVDDLLSEEVDLVFLPYLREFPSSTNGTHGYLCPIMQDLPGVISAFFESAAVGAAEVDPETGTIEIRRYTSIDDGGQPINPLILHGQVHGGVAQGMGQAMLEAAVYEPGSAQLLSASFLDYGMPRADHFPHMEVELTEDPTKGNPLRVKGGGDAANEKTGIVRQRQRRDEHSGDHRQSQCVRKLVLHDFLLTKV